MSLTLRKTGNPEWSSLPSRLSAYVSSSQLSSGKNTTVVPNRPPLKPTAMPSTPVWQVTSLSPHFLPCQMWFFVYSLSGHQED